jgi:hypothetical protein
MKESGPEVKESKLKTEAKNAGITVAVFAIMLAVSASLAKVAKIIDPPEEKYKMAIKIKPSKEGKPLSLDVKFIKQCVENVVHAAPSSFGKTVYKDCE